MTHMKVGAGALLVLFCLGTAVTSAQDKDTKAAPQTSSSASKPSGSSTVDGGVKSISGYNTQKQSPSPMTASSSAG